LTTPWRKPGWLFEFNKLSAIMSESELLVELAGARALAFALCRNGPYDEPAFVKVLQTKYCLHHATAVWITRHARRCLTVSQDGSSVLKSS
jgi:hypothetical protein